MIETLKRRVPEGVSNLESIRVELDTIPFEDHSVDKVLLAFVFHELSDQHKYLEIIHGLLKTGGQLTIVEWLPVPLPPALHSKTASVRTNWRKSCALPLSGCSPVMT